MRAHLTRPITPDEVNAYHTAGVVLLRGVLDLATVNLMRRCIDDGVQSLGVSPAGYDLSRITSAYESRNADHLNEESGGQHDIAGIMNFIRDSGKELLFDKPAASTGSFLLDTGLSSRHDAFRKLILAGPFAEIAGSLLRSHEVRYFGDQLFVKEPQTRERTAFHQDATYFNIEGYDCCVLWVPSDPVTLLSGALQYVRGSHLDGKLYNPNVFIAQTPLPGASEAQDVPDIEGDPEAFDVVNFDTEPGDILVHHYKTLHGAGGNMSRYQVRRAASIRYCGDDIRFRSRSGAPAQLHHVGPKLNDGDVLQGADFPVVWKRPRQEQAAA